MDVYVVRYLTAASLDNERNRRSSVSLIGANICPVEMCWSLQRVAKWDIAERLFKRRIDNENEHH